MMSPTLPSAHQHQNRKKRLMLPNEKRKHKKAHVTHELIPCNNAAQEKENADDSMHKKCKIKDARKRKRIIGTARALITDRNGGQGRRNIDDSTQKRHESKDERKSKGIIVNTHGDQALVTDPNQDQEKKNVDDSTQKRHESKDERKRKGIIMKMHGNQALITDHNRGQEKGNADDLMQKKHESKDERKRKRIIMKVRGNQALITDPNRGQEKGNTDDSTQKRHEGKGERKRKGVIEKAHRDQAPITNPYGGQDKGIDGASIQKKSNKKRVRKRMKESRRGNVEQALDTGVEATIEAAGKQKKGIVNVELGSSAANPKASSLLDKMRARLSGGQFRMLNEKLYTCCGEDALKMFKGDPTAFELYHAGYQEQISKWPRLPIQVIIDWLKTKGQSLTVADFGCGDARLAKSVMNKVYSFDLVSNDPSVIACDMSRTPLSAASVDVVIFCLSLMGTNYPEYLAEAHRVVKLRGWMLIAEVKSRFDVDRGGADVEKFVKAMRELGFLLFDKDDTNRMFVIFYFRKEGGGQFGSILWPKLKPCLYKRR